MRRVYALVSSQAYVVPLNLCHRRAVSSITTAAMNPTDVALRGLLSRKVIAVVGISADPSKPSHHVATEMQKHGYRIVPVRPGNGSLLGEKIVARLGDVSTEQAKGMLVNVFRKPDDVEPIVDEAIAIGATAIWFQLGVVNENAIRKATRAGMTVVADKCLWIEYQRLIGGAQ